MSVLAAVLTRQELQFLLEAAPAAKQFLSTEGVVQEPALGQAGLGQALSSLEHTNQDGNGNLGGYRAGWELNLGGHEDGS